MCSVGSEVVDTNSMSPGGVDVGWTDLTAALGRLHFTGPELEHIEAVLLGLHALGEWWIGVQWTCHRE
jgi:hypothetical protein